MLLDRALDIDPNFVRARAARGYARWRNYFAGWNSSPTNLDAALDDVAAAFRRDPQSITALTALVRICWDKGWHEKAVAASWRMRAVHPDSLEAVLAYARALHNAGMADDALPLTRSVLQVDPGNPTALKLLIWNHLMTGDYLSAIQAARCYLPQAPADANTRWAAASAHFHAGDHEEAIHIAREAASADPDDITIRSLHGHLLRRAGQADGARSVWTDTLDHFTNRAGMTLELSPRTQAWLASIEASLGRHRQAESRLKMIAASEPENGYLTYRSMHVLAEMGDRARAAHSLAQAVRHGFRSVQLLKHDESFELAPLAAEAAYRRVVGELDGMVTDIRGRYATRQFSYASQRKVELCANGQE